MLKGLLNISRHTVRVIWISANILLMVGLVAASYGGYIGPGRIVIGQFFNMSFPIWLALSIVALIANVVVMRRMAGAWVAVMLCCGGPILAFSPMHFATERIAPAEKSRVLTVMTYNVFNLDEFEKGGQCSTSRSLSYILKTDPDIVCLQEPSYFLNGHRPRFRVQADSVARRYPYHTKPSENRSTTLMVLSKYPINCITPKQPGWESGCYSAYMVNAGPGRELMVIVLHLQSIGLTQSDKELYRELTDTHLNAPTAHEMLRVRSRLMGKLNNAFKLHAEQARHIVNFVESQNPTNLIIAGDFNDVPGSYPYRLLINDLRLHDAYAQTGLGPIITYSANHFYFHIDHILYRGNLLAIKTEKGRLRSSDHYPLTTTFLWDNR